MQSRQMFFIPNVYRQEAGMKMRLKSLAVEPFMSTQVQTIKPLGKSLLCSACLRDTSSESRHNLHTCLILE